jgi:hypothetical protein
MLTIISIGPDRLLLSLLKLVASLPIGSGGLEICPSHQVASHEISQTLVTAVPSEALSFLLTLIRQDHLDDSSRLHQ